VVAPRHLEILRLYAEGKTRAEIGAELYIAPVTVMNRLAEVRSILGAENSTHAVTICIARGLLCVDHRSERVYIPRPIDQGPQSAEGHDLPYAHADAIFAG
jgi:DNA-binding CsgD family transcriptional regulator